MTDREKLRRAEKRVWKLLSRLYNKGCLASLGFEKGGYHFSFWHGSIHVPEKKIKNQK